MACLNVVWQFHEPVEKEFGVSLPIFQPGAVPTMVKKLHEELIPSLLIKTDEKTNYRTRAISDCSQLGATLD